MCAHIATHIKRTAAVVHGGDGGEEEEALDRESRCFATVGSLVEEVANCEGVAAWRRREYGRARGRRRGADGERRHCAYNGGERAQMHEERRQTRKTKMTHAITVRMCALSLGAFPAALLSTRRSRNATVASSSDSRTPASSSTRSGKSFRVSTALRRWRTCGIAPRRSIRLSTFALSKQNK